MCAIKLKDTQHLFYFLQRIAPDEPALILIKNETYQVELLILSTAFMISF